MRREMEGEGWTDGKMVRWDDGVRCGREVSERPGR